ncbi:hypothetical protein GCM10023174_00840 [Chelativorans composti]
MGRNVLRAILGIALLIGAASYVLANHSATQITLTCSGKWVEDGGAEEVVVAIEEYRPWILWSASDGNLRASSKNIPLVIYVSNIEKIGGAPITFYSFSHYDGRMIGGYRVPFNELALKFADNLTFTGNCVERH